MSDPVANDDTFTRVIQIVGAGTGALLLCASLFVHIYLCAKRRQKNEMQSFLIVILCLMHVSNAVTVGLFSTTIDGQLIFEGMTCTTWISNNMAVFMVVILEMVCYLVYNWVFVNQYLKVAQLLPIVFGSEPISGRSNDKMRQALGCLKWANVVFYGLTFGVFLITMCLRSGTSMGCFNVPWIFMTAMMVYAIGKIKSVLREQESNETFVLNETLMTAYLVLYVVYCLLYVSFSISDIILGKAINEYYSEQGESKSYYTKNLVNDSLMLAKLLAGCMIQAFMLTLFLRFSQPYDPIHGRDTNQKSKTMLVFNPEKDRLIGYRDHRYDSID